MLNAASQTRWWLALSPVLALPVLTLLGLALLGHSTEATASDESDSQRVDFGRHAVTRVQPGTVVGKNKSKRWNRVVLLAKPRLALGAVSKLSSQAHAYATRFSVVIMASVGSKEGDDGVTTYQLDRVGLGCCVTLDGRTVVVSSGTQKQLGASLDTIERFVLTQNEKGLRESAQIVRTDTYAIVDVDALVLHAGKHQEMLLRYMIWVRPDTGKVASLVWPLKKQGKGPLQFVGESFMALPGGFVEDRVIHVSPKELTLGIPSSRAFALAGLPRGKPITATAELTRLAARKEYTSASLLQFVTAVQKAF